MNPANVKAACALTPQPPHSKTWRSLVASLVVLAATIIASAHPYSIDWLKVNTNLATANWVRNSQAVINNGTIRDILVSPLARNRFYRLKSP